MQVGKRVFPSVDVRGPIAVEREKWVEGPPPGVVQRECQQLLNAIELHLRAFTAAYGEAAVHPKHHLMLHLPRQLQRDSRLIDCFVHERKHRVIKAEARNIDGQPHFERTCLARMVVEQRGALSDPMFFLTG